jgi:hypothetical protein
MTFLHWNLLLWTLPLAAIPILLHLLTLHRLKTVELSTFRFLFDSYVQQRRRMQFLEALLAMLRTAFLLLLLAVICRPVVRHWGSLFHSGSGREVILLVDCSASMKAQTAGVPAFDRAKGAARAVAERLAPEDRVTLIRVASHPEEVFSRFSSDAATVQDKIEGLKCTSSRGNLFAALMQVFGPEAPQRTNPVVYLFTDCQATGWREVRNQGLDRMIPQGTQFVVVNVGSDQEVPNLAVIGDAPARQRAIVGLPVVLQPRVVNTSKKEPADVTVTVLIDEKEVARSTLTLKPGETGARKIIYVPTEPGVHRGRFEISGKAPDRFPDDDRFLFTLTVAPRIKVVLVNGNPATADPLESETLYLRAALTATDDGPRGEKKGAGLEPPKEYVRSLDVVDIPEAALNAETLRDASVVALANCGALNAQQFEWLRGFVAGGGGLMIFPGDRVNPEIYETQFFPVPGPQQERLTGVTMGPPEGDPEKTETFERLAVIDFAHPALTVFDDPDGHYLRSLRFYRRFKLTLPEKRDSSWPLAEFANGAPALVESRLGDGRVLLAAFPANTKWSNLPVKPEFVPLVLRLTSHVEHRPEVEVPAVVPPDGVAEVSVTGTWGPLTGKVADAAGRPAPPLEFQRAGSRLVATFDRTAERGYYAVEIQGGAGGQAKVGNLAFAVNLAPEESDFAPVNEGQIRDMLPSAQVTVVDASAEAQQEHGVIGDEREVWRPLIYLMFAVITVEFLLATIRGGRKDQEENLSVAERIQRINPGTWVGRMTGAARREGAGP